MATITLSVPNGLKKRMNKHEIINWSAVARQAIEKRIVFIEALETFAMENEMTEEDTLRLGREVAKSMNDKNKSINNSVYKKRR